MRTRLPFTDQEIEALVGGLDNLQWNLRVQVDIFRLGARAVPALVNFLLGPPNQFPEGRVFAAEALGRLKEEAAFQGLLNAINPRRFDGLSPLLRLPEEAVQNAAARQLAHIGDRRAIPVLLDALRTRHLVGAAEALVEFQEAAALPWLLDGLEDAFKRDHFSQAILGIGRTAIPSLMTTLEQRRLHEEQELLPSIERRAEALRLLGLLGAQEAVDPIRIGLHDPNEKVRTEAALALVAVDNGDGVLDAVPALVAGLTHPDFLQRKRCADALEDIGPRCLRFLRQALTDGGVMVGGEAVQLTTTARQDLLEILER